MWKKINKPEGDYVEWLRDNQNDNSNNFHLVHNRNKCLYSEKIEMGKGYSIPGLHLQCFLDEDGLMRFLEILDTYNLVNPYEIIELIKRTQITGYEQARFHFEKGSSEGIIDGPGEHGYYPSINQNQKLSD